MDLNSNCMDADGDYALISRPAELKFKIVMPINQLGKFLFPRLQPWQRERRIKTFIVVFLVAVAFAVIVGGVMFLRNSRQG